MTTIFQGFTADSFLFFQELARNNQKAWFDANRARYDQHVVGAFRGLLESLTPALLKLNPHFEVGGKTNGSFSRINRDIRFSKDKSPYKSNLLSLRLRRPPRPRPRGPLVRRALGGLRDRGLFHLRQLARTQGGT